MKLPEDIIKLGLVYDVETYPNFFSVTFASLNRIAQNQSDCFKQFVISESRNDREKILATIRDRYLIGFNNSNFDDGVIEFISRNPQATVEAIYAFAQSCIEGWNVFKNSAKSFSRSYDLLEIIRAGYNVISLKGVGVNLKYPKVQDLPFHYTDEIKPEDEPTLLDYNKNDVEVTLKLLEAVEGELNMRADLSSLFNAKLHSASDSAIAKILLNKWYQEKASMSNEAFKEFKQSKTERDDIWMVDIIYPYIKFKTQELQAFLSDLKNKVIKKIDSTPARDKYECDIPKLTFKGTTYSIGLGGIHSEDKPTVIRATGDRLLLDADVMSQYPLAILNNNLCPQHLDPNVFLPLLKDIVDQRLYHKKRRKESKESDVIQAGLKIAINSVYGLLNSKTFWLFDPQVTFAVTVNNQLMLMMLVEDLEEAGYSVISANTDGIIVDSTQDKLEDIRRIYKAWEKVTRFELEETHYELYVRRDVNNYLSRTIDGSIKTKGCFVPQGGLINGYKFPVVAMALQAYFLEGTDPLIFLHNHKDIYDFCASQKVGGQFTNVIEDVSRVSRTLGKTGKPLKKPIHEYTVLGAEDTQKTVRYYVSKPEEKMDASFGKRMRKRKIVDGESHYIDYVAGYFVTLFNDYFEAEDYNIDYDFYLKEVQKEIDKIEAEPEVIEIEPEPIVEVQLMLI